MPPPRFVHGGFEEAPEAIVTYLAYQRGRYAQ